MRKNYSVSRTVRILCFYISLIIILPSARAFSFPGAPGDDTTTYSLHVKAGWNLLSLPVEVTGGMKETIFPTAVSNAFVFDSAYRVVDTLENGRGFWLKFASTETIAVSGVANYTHTINLRAGWNLIGILSSPVALKTIRTDPPGIVASNYFGFYPPPLGYQKVDTLQPGMGYWVKVSQAGMMVMKTMDVACPGISTLDYGGKTYNTVQIGAQCWLRENLDVGEMIQGTDTASNNGTIEKYCYGNDTANCTLYGGLYQWNEAMQYGTTPGTQGICPPGWHIPTNTEFVTLKSTVSNDGNALKAIGQGTGDGAGTNTSGFSALLSGNRTGGYFFGLGITAHFWSSTQVDASFAYNLRMHGNTGLFYVYDAYTKDFGFSVRCLED